MLYKNITSNEVHAAFGETDVPFIECLVFTNQLKATVVAHMLNKQMSWQTMSYVNTLGSEWRTEYWD